MPRRKKTETVIEEPVAEVTEDEETFDEEATEDEEETIEPVLDAGEPFVTTVRVDTLRNAVELLVPVVPRKTSLPVLTNILLKDGKAMASDLETAVMVNLPAFDGACLLPARKVSDLLKHVGGFQQLTIEYSRGKVSLNWDDGRARYDVPKPATYPDINVPDISEEAQAELDGETLVTALTVALPYCSTDEARLLLTGVTLHLGERLRVAGADGFRLSYQELDMSFPIEATAIIPARAIEILEFLWKRVPPAPKPVDDLIAAITARRLLGLGVANEVLVIWLPNVTLVSKLISGSPPDFKQLIPQNHTYSVLVFASELERGLRRIKDIAKGSNDAVLLSWDQNILTIAAKGEEQGEVETTLPAVTDQPGKVAINVSYLLDYLKGKTNAVRIIANRPSEPILLRYQKAPDVIIMPMNVQW